MFQDGAGQNPPASSQQTGTPHPSGTETGWSQSLINGVTDERTEGSIRQEELPRTSNSTHARDVGEVQGASSHPQSHNGNINNALSSQKQAE